MGRWHVGARAAALCLAAIACAPRAGGPRGQSPIGGGSALVGRFAAERESAGCRPFAWGQTAVAVRFLGEVPELTVGKSDTNPMPVDFDVFLDGRLAGVRRAVGLGASLGPLVPRPSDPRAAANPAVAADGAHTLRLVRRTEALAGETQFCGVLVPPGTTLLPPPPPAARRLWVVGDSISAGYGNEGQGPDCRFDPGEENGSLAFGPLAAAELGAEVEVLAWSGRGVWRNRDGSRADTVPALIGRDLPEDPSSTSAVDRRRADYVVVNLGTNDFSGGPVDDVAFVDAYVALLEDLRARAPAAHVVVALGPMIRDEPKTPGALDHARRLLEAALARRRAAGEGEGQLSFLEFPAQDGRLGYGCDWHPSLATHRDMAARLAAHLRARAGKRRHGDGNPSATGS